MCSIILIILNLIIFIGYNTYIIKKFGIPESLSATTYLMGQYYWIFPLICGFFTFTILPVWLIQYQSAWDVLKFFSCAGILFVGATPFFKKQLDGKIHYTSAIISAVCFITWMIINGFYLWVVRGAIVLLIILLFSKFKNFVYYGEIVLWLTLLLFLIF